MTENVASPHRRFQFRPRTLMIGVTLLAVPLVYVGRQWHVAAERATMRERIRALGGGGNVTGRDMWMWCLGWEEYQAKTIPFIRRWFGDSAEPFLFLPDETPNEDMGAIGQAFPEALVRRVPRETIRGR
jgi:hypothetical protein